MNRILWSIVIGIATTVCAVKADEAISEDARKYGDWLAEPAARDLLSNLRANGFDDKEILNSFADLVYDLNEAQKEGYTSSSEKALFATLAGVQCAYQLGATPKHPPGFDTPAPTAIPPSEQTDSKTLNSDVAATSMAVKITGNRWTSDQALIATGTLTNTSLAPVTVTKVVATGFDGNKNLVAVAHGLPGDGSFTIANAEIAPGARAGVELRTLVQPENDDL